MEMISYVKDLLLDYAYKKVFLKGNDDSKEKQEALDEDFVANMMVLRNRFPEYLFINYKPDITEAEAKEVFVNIKSKATRNYLFYIPLPQYAPISIDGIKLEIPIVSTCTTPYKNRENSKGLFVLDYDTNENKIACLNQALIQILMTLPIKKILLNFVDLKAKYEDDFLLQNLPPLIYNEAPITSEEQLLRLLDRLEKRKLEVITKYDVFGKYCVQHKTFPMPYEFVVLYDEVYDEAIRTRLNTLIDDSARIGIYFILPRKATKVIDGISESYVFSPDGRAIYSSGIPEYIKYGIDAFYSGLRYIYYNRTAKEVDMLTDMQNRPNDSKIIVGESDYNYEVWLDKERPSWLDKETPATDFYIREAQRLFDRIESPIIKEMLVNLPAHVFLGCFPTEEQACSFIDCFCDQHNLPTFVGQTPFMYLYTSEARRHDVEFFEGREIHRYEIINGYDIVLYIFARDFFNYIEDFEFYFHYFGFPKDSVIRVCELFKGGCNVNYEKEDVNPENIELRYWNHFKSKEDADDYIGHLIHNVHEEAKKKWGDNFSYSHLSVNPEKVSWAFQRKQFDSFMGERQGEQYLGIEIKIKREKNNKIPIEHFEVPKNDGIINFTPITNNPTLLKACIDYIRTEAEAKEEMKVQNLDFGSAAASKYETDLSTMIIPVGKAESKDADFRMDLVSHVHSFIIGQSGSGKSVFLHNIIGGAMLKYAPEDLQLYLLDFKLGGVEFNRYKGAKHVKALLVDNSDPQVTLEILRELLRNMTERGKMLQRNGCNKIDEYNKLHQEDRMPHVLVVADECHEMFKSDDSIPRQVRNEISDIVIKIAKEGRSQGVHLVFATQTLSGTEISSEIINNVSDFYLLKCAQTDSERLVPNSSAITSELSTGQIYYHHVDEQMKFQAYYTDKETAEKLMAAIVEKAKDHKSNGEFYFNGAQMFYLDEAVKEQMLAVKGKSPLAFMGKAIDISQKDLFIKLNEDFSENVLLLGLNDQEQVTRTTMNLFVSLMMSAKLKHKDIAFKVIDCLNNEEGEVHELIFDLENEGYCDIIERRQRSKFFKELAKSVQDGTAEETILLILGQDRFRELKMDMELEESNSSKSSDDDDMMSISDDFFGDSSSSSTNVRTYRDALNVILEKGPDYGVHTLLQIEKASNLLFEDYITPKVVFQKFKHLVMLKSDETAGVTLHLNDDIRLEKLSSDWERLRAYYYAEESDSYTLFTPYMPSKSKDIINLIKTI